MAGISCGVIASRKSRFQTYKGVSRRVVENTRADNTEPGACGNGGEYAGRETPKAASLVKLVSRRLRRAALPPAFPAVFPDTAPVSFQSRIHFECSPAGSVLHRKYSVPIASGTMIFALARRAAA
jgi:hypothetical protein